MFPVQFIFPAKLQVASDPRRETKRQLNLELHLPALVFAPAYSGSSQSRNSLSTGRGLRNEVCMLVPKDMIVIEGALTYVTFWRYVLLAMG
jgi:hypothetical protein